MRQLPPERASIFYYRDVLSMTPEDVGRRLGKRRGPIDTHVSRARASLREFLKEYGPTTATSALAPCEDAAPKFMAGP